MTPPPRCRPLRARLSLGGTALKLRYQSSNGRGRLNEIGDGGLLGSWVWAPASVWILPAASKLSSFPTHRARHHTAAAHRHISPQQQTAQNAHAVASPWSSSKRNVRGPRWGLHAASAVTCRQSSAITTSSRARVRPVAPATSEVGGEALGTPPAMTMACP